MCNNGDVYGLLYGCPFGEREEGCPFKQYDFLSFKKKYQLIIKLDEKEIIKMLEYHHNCSQRREGKYKMRILR